MLKNKRPVHKYCTLLLNLSMGREELGRSLKLSGEEPSLTREVVVPRGWANHCCFFISLASGSIPLDTNAIAGSAGQRKNQSFDFLARGLGSGPQGARKCQQDHKEKEAQERNFAKLYSTPGLTSELRMVLTFSSLPNALSANCSIHQCPDPAWLQGGAQGSQIQLALQRL